MKINLELSASIFYPVIPSILFLSVCVNVRADYNQSESPENRIQCNNIVDLWLHRHSYTLILWIDGCIGTLIHLYCGFMVAQALLYTYIVDL